MTNDSQRPIEGSEAVDVGQGVRLTRPEGTPPEAWNLFLAAAKGDLNRIRSIAGDSPERIHHEHWYEFPLHYAVRMGRVDAVQLLLDLGSDPARSSFTYSSWPRLLKICKDRAFHEVHDVLTTEMRRRFHYSEDYRTLWDAIHAGDHKQFDEILNDHAEWVHISDGHGNRALHWAVLSRRLQMIEQLIERGADLHAERADSQTPLHLSIEGDYWFRKTGLVNPETTPEQVTTLLVQLGARMEFAVAAYMGDFEFVAHQLQLSPDKATKLNAARRSPLANAAGQGHLDIVRMLLDCQANPNLPEECAPSGAALFRASAGCHIEIMKLLLQNGADPNAEFDSCGNCLSIADRGNQRSQQAVELLRHHGAKPGLWMCETAESIALRLRDDKELLPTADLWSGLINTILRLDDHDLLQLFVERFGSEKIRELNPTNGWRIPTSESMLDRLLEYGMNINATDWYGKSFLHAVATDETTDRAAWFVARGIETQAVDIESGLTALGMAQQNNHTAMVRLLGSPAGT